MYVTAWLLFSGIIGAIVGWIASVAARKGVPHFVMVNIAIGAIGAILGAGFLSPEFGSSLLNRGNIPLGVIVAACTGATVLVSVVFLCWRDRHT